MAAFVRVLAVDLTGMAQEVPALESKASVIVGRGGEALNAVVASHLDALRGGTVGHDEAPFQACGQGAGVFASQVDSSLFDATRRRQGGECEGEKEGG